MESDDTRRIESDEATQPVLTQLTVLGDFGSNEPKDFIRVLCTS